MISHDQEYLREAIILAKQAQSRGNLPIGAVIVLDGQIISTGMNSIWKPSIHLTRHAEIEALHNIPAKLFSHRAEMSLYTTLEPCVMCAGAILLYHIGRVAFGSSDPVGGASSCFSSLPPYFLDAYSHMEWSGPLLPAECDPLYQLVHTIEGNREDNADAYFSDL